MSCSSLGWLSDGVRISAPAFLLRFMWIFFHPRILYPSRKAPSSSSSSFSSYQSVFAFHEPITPRGIVSKIFWYIITWIPLCLKMLLYSDSNLIHRIYFRHLAILHFSPRKFPFLLLFLSLMYRTQAAFLTSNRVLKWNFRIKKVRLIHRNIRWMT